MHVLCGESVKDADGDSEGYGEKVLCNICKMSKKILAGRKDCITNLKKQGEAMMKYSNNKFSDVPIASTVSVALPEVDRCKGDLRKVLAIVINVTDNGFYKLGTKNGILKQLYSRSEF